MLMHCPPLAEHFVNIGGYVDEGHRTPAQEHLEQWGEQDWHTASGDADARDAGGTSRYLPDVAWQLLTPAERRAMASLSLVVPPERFGWRDAGKLVVFRTRAAFDSPRFHARRGCTARAGARRRRSPRTARTESQSSRPAAPPPRAPWARGARTARAARQRPPNRLW